VSWCALHHLWGMAQSFHQLVTLSIVCIFCAPACRREADSSFSLQDTEESRLVLQHISVVLVAPKHASNIGAVARACANFEVCSDAYCRAQGIACPELSVLQKVILAAATPDASAYEGSESL
jgi:hypothetical protein